MINPMPNLLGAQLRRLGIQPGTFKRSTNSIARKADQIGPPIGAGGHGRPILRDVDKFDVPLMLEGAIPAAVMALAVQGLFELLERAVTVPEA